MSITRLQIIQSLQPTLSNAVFLSEIFDTLDDDETPVASDLIQSTISLVKLSDLTEADKRKLFRLNKFIPRQTKTLEDFLTPDQIATIQALRD